MQKISILTSCIDYGNMEKYIVSLSNLLYKDYDITIVSAYEVRPVYKIERSIKVLYLKKDLKLNNLDNLLNKHKYITYFKYLIKNYKSKRIEKKLMIDYIENNDSDTIISTNSKYSKWLTKHGKNIKKIGINNDDFTNKKINKVIKSYKNLDYFISLTIEQNNFFKNYFNNVIYIPLFLEHQIVSKSQLESNRILFIGDLNKDIYTLIDIFKKVCIKHNDWYLDIIGEGIEYESIRKKLEQENLNIDLYKLEDIKDIEKVYLNSSIYISLSKNVFSISLLDALSYGIPSLAFLDKMGSNKLITDNYDGYLVKYSDKDKMVRRINDLIENKNRRIIMGMNALKKKDKYDKLKVKETLEKIL